jgi:hypothetical protein
VPNLKHDLSGWHICDDVPVISDPKGSDHLEATRIKADIDDSMKGDKHWPLTTDQVLIVEYLGIRHMNVRDFCSDYQKGHKRHMGTRDAWNEYRFGTIKMARNLGWKEPGSEFEAPIILDSVPIAKA